MAYTKQEKLKLIDDISSSSTTGVFSRTDVLPFVKLGDAFPHWISKGKIGYNRFSIEKLKMHYNNDNITTATTNNKIVVNNVNNDDTIITTTTNNNIDDTEQQRINLIPEKCPLYTQTKNGFSGEVKAIIESKRFLPVYIHGASGTGKTYTVIQEAAIRNLPVVRMNITEATGDDDLIGGFRLKDGDTVWHDGPIITAMRMGAILILDEIDRASNLILALQPVLEGKAVHVAKTGETIQPSEGFKIFATANSNGRGESTSSRYVSARVQDDATLERFPVFLQSKWMTRSEEAKTYTTITKIHNQELTDELKTFIKDLSVLVTNIRELYDNSSIDDVISTRRGCHIIELYEIFGGRKSIELATNRFDSETQESILQTYDIIGEGRESTTDNGND